MPRDIKKVETFKDFCDDLLKDGLDMIYLTVRAWMHLDNVEPEDKIPNDWKEGF